ncbi:hypothetical protein [Cereibacter changlensis]
MKARQNNAAAEVDLQRMEAELRDTLASARARKTGSGDTTGTSLRP